MTEEIENFLTNSENTIIDRSLYNVNEITGLCHGKPSLKKTIL